jgi:hypothetical protein
MKLDLTNDQTAMTASWHGWLVPAAVEPELSWTSGDERVYLSWHGLAMHMTVSQAELLRDKLAAFLLTDPEQIVAAESTVPLVDTAEDVGVRE